MHVSSECDIMCWGKDGVSLRSSWNKDVVGMNVWVVDNPVGSGVGAKLPEIFRWCFDVFNYYFLSPISVFRLFGCNIGSVKCGSVQVLGKRVVVRFSEIGQ